MSEQWILLVVRLSSSIGYAARSSWSNWRLTESWLSSVPTPYQTCFVVDAIFLFVVGWCRWCALIVVFCLYRYNAQPPVVKLVRTRPIRRCWTACSPFFPQCWPLIARLTHLCVCPREQPELNHSIEPGLTQSNSLPALAVGLNIAFVFWDKWPHFVCTHFLGLDCLDFGIVNQLSFLTGSAHNAHDRVVSQPSGTTDAP